MSKLQDACNAYNTAFNKYTKARDAEDNPDVIAALRTEKNFLWDAVFKQLSKEYDDNTMNITSTP